MRLLDAEALIYHNVARLVEFPDADRAPSYAILSHTWAEEEVLFEDIKLGPQHEIATDTDFCYSQEYSKLTRRIDPWLSEGFWPRSDAESMKISSDEDDSDFLPINENVDEMEIGSVLKGSGDGTVSESTKSSPPTSTDAEVHVKAGWNKVLNTCLISVRDRLRYVWIDTCCIDKSSSAELSEAINSMYDWYKAARRCYAYLNDCSIPSKPEWEVIVRDSAARLNKYFRWDRLSFRLRPPLIDPVKCICMGHREEYKQEQRDSMYDLLKHCRWFTRGWTLQELIAPKQVIFHDRHWQMVAKRRDILLTLEEITGIHKEALEPSFFGSDDSLSRFSIAQRMYWASSRHTTREEDAAYCLLGIFQINMPLLYGEGERAFKRLQEEIMKATPDQSIFAWEHPDNRFWIDSSLLAESTFYFQGARNIRYAGWDENLPLPGSEFRMTHQGLEIELWIDEYRLQHNYNTQVAALDCVLEQPDGHSSRVGLFLFQSPINSWQSHSDGAYPTHIVFNRAEQRMWDRRLLKLPLSWTSRPLSKRKLLIADDDLWHRVKCYDVQIEMDFLQKREVLSARWRILATYPRFQWSDRTLKLPDIDNACGGVAIDSLDYGTIFIILGVDTDIPRHTCNPFSHDRSYKYWILKELEPDPGISPSSSTLRSRNEDGFSPRTEQRVLQICALEKYEFYLEKLCDCASTFGAKDFFEHTTRRTESHKSIVLPDNKVLRASFNKSMEAPGLYDAPYRPSKMLLRLHVEPGSEESSISSDEDYFRLRNIERLFLTELTERRKWEWC